MWHVILFILKLIGWILLAILGILVLLVLLVLFLPIKYQIVGESKGDLPSSQLEIKVSYFFHLVSVIAAYRDEAFSWKCKLAWKSLSSEEDEEEGEEKKKQELFVQSSEKKEKQPEKKVLPSSGATVTQTVQKKKEPAKEPIKESAKESIKEPIKEPVKNPVKKPIKEQARESIKEPEKQPSKETVEGEKKKKWVCVLDKLKCKYEAIRDKIEVLIQKKEILVRFFESEVHQYALKKVWREAKRLFARIFPKQIKGDFTYGFENPYWTGKLLAVLSMVYPLFSEQLSVIPDFEQAILEGNLEIKGNLFVYPFAICALKLLLDKKIRLTYRRIMKLKNKIF